MATRSLSRTVETRFPDLVLLTCVLGFAFLVAELILFDHWRGLQLIGFSSAILGLLLSLLAFARARALRAVVMALLGLLMLAGLYGLLAHHNARVEDAARFAQRQSQGGSQSAPAGQAAGQGPQGGPPGGGTFRSNVPVLSPLALSGLSALTLLAMVARRPDPQD